MERLPPASRHRRFARISAWVPVESMKGTCDASTTSRGSRVIWVSSSTHRTNSVACDRSRSPESRRTRSAPSWTISMCNGIVSQGSRRLQDAALRQICRGWVWREAGSVRRSDAAEWVCLEGQMLAWDGSELEHHHPDLDEPGCVIEAAGVLIGGGLDPRNARQSSGPHH